MVTGNYFADPYGQYSTPLKATSVSSSTTSTTTATVQSSELTDLISNNTLIYIARGVMLLLLILKR